MDSVSENNSVDNLLAGSAVETVTGTDRALAPDQGALVRGQLLEVNDISLDLQVVSSSYGTAPSLSILAVDVATSAATQSCVTYNTGEFAKGEVKLDALETLTIDEVADACRQVNIHLKDTADNNHIEPA